MFDKEHLRFSGVGYRTTSTSSNSAAIADKNANMKMWLKIGVKIRPLGTQANHNQIFAINSLCGRCAALSLTLYCITLR
jgi:hypothetical protein